MYLKRITPNFRGMLNPVLHASQNSKKIALTFDACSTLLPSRTDSAVIEILIRSGTPATLFLGGKWVLDRPDDARFLTNIPFFEIGNHSYLHGHLTRVSDERLRDEIRLTQEIIYTVTGVAPQFFRPPYIEYDDRVIQAASSFGLTTVIGDVPSGDPDPNATKDKLIAEILHGVKTGSIVIMHMNQGGKHTAEALPETIRLLRENGYELVTMSDLLKNPDSGVGR